MSCLDSIGSSHTLTRRRTSARSVGRYANRIANARFAIDGREHRVSPNEPPNHLHGGFKGFDKHVWDAEAVRQRNRRSCFAAESPDGEEGYPGTLDAQVTYTIADRELRISYRGRHRRADAREPDPTFVFQFARHRRCAEPLPRDQREHVPAGRRHVIPTGELAPVANSPFDFQESVGDWLAPSHRSRATDSAAADTITTSTSIAADAPLALAARVLEPRADGRSRCARPSPDCSSIRARWSAIAGSASSRSIIPTRRTGRNSPRHCCGRASAISRRRRMYLAGSCSW